MEAKMKLERSGGCGGETGGVGGGGAPPPLSNHCRRRSFGRPSWLLFSIADLDERMKLITASIYKDNDNADSFAHRADAYYQKRPQLLALLQELYNGYVSLADRYCQALAKNHNPHHRRYSSLISPFHFIEHDQFDEDQDSRETIDSDVESSLSYQTPFPAPAEANNNLLDDADTIVADLVTKSVDYNIMLNEMNIVERKFGDSSRKAELQNSLLDVLESERLILLNENASLGFRVNALLEENKGLVTESLFMKRKAADLARCVLKMRDDHRVCLLSKKIEDLQGQIYGLEKRNKEYYEQLVKHEEEKRNGGSKGKEEIMKGKSIAGGVTLDDCFRVPEEAVFSCFGISNSKKKGRESKGGKKASPKIWERVKKFDIFMCVPHVNSATYC